MARALGRIAFLLFLCCWTFVADADARRALPDNNLAIPVLISQSTGEASGFYYRHGERIFFVTARHVLFANAVETLERVPRGLDIPADIRLEIKTSNDKKTSIIFEGVMSLEEKDRLLKVNEEEHWQSAVKKLYDQSQRPALASKTATLWSYPSHISQTARDRLDLQLQELHSAGKVRYHKSQDVATVEIGRTTGGEEGFQINLNAGVKIIENAKLGLIMVPLENTKKLSDVLIGNNVYVFGYPTSIGLLERSQIDRDRPLVRSGIVAGKNLRRATIVLDCPVYPGNSGGPVIEEEQVGFENYKFRVIGFVLEFVPYTKDRFENSGYSVAAPIDAVLELVSE